MFDLFDLIEEFPLSEEQERFVAAALEGKNILVDACIGSGKTTAIQRLCDRFPPKRKILYLTYNRLLKLDARAKIKRRNVTVTNYHGFAYTMLKNCGVRAGVPDLIQTFLRVKPPLPRYDVLVLDEYQDIEEELAELLEYVKSKERGMQIVAVGDMEQKIYDKTALDVKGFVDRFLGDCERMTFTKCFRLSQDHAAMLGRIWNKRIEGVNPRCEVVSMNLRDAVRFLSKQRPRDILCLGSRVGPMTAALNMLEDDYPETFNKSTIYASIRDDDGNRAVEPNERCAIFTTYDSSKGLERNICVVFDFTESYWMERVEKPMQSYEILRNIFCVAASRGKEKIVFVTDGEARLSEESLSTDPLSDTPLQDMDISSMFDFKYIEDVEACYALLKTSPIPREDREPLHIRDRDELIDLSPCVGVYQEAVFFENFDIDREIRQFFDINPDLEFLYTPEVRARSVDGKILFLTSLETNQARYRKQVAVPFVREEEKNALVKRLETVFSPGEEVQTPCRIPFAKETGEQAFCATGLADVVKDGVVYELKFVNELSHVHFLQCASYMIGLGLPKGILWNTRTNTMFEIEIPNRTAYLDAVAAAVTKRRIRAYFPPRANRPQ